MVKFQYVEELQHVAFPAPNVNINDFDEESIFVAGCPFWQETLFYTKNEGVQPWANDAEKACRKLTKQMTAILSAMEAKFRAHEKPDSYLVQDALGIFLSILFWSNRKPVRLENLNEALNELSIKPLNLEERLEYCLMRAHTFPGFKQLNELLLEQRKLIAKHK
ncbi:MULTISPECIES: YpoC family protein [unclassified Listeria]|uniref:YpoC family protein n=1 Tax=unclassified Listeria TaxID=2642072 RepID=UPI000B596492|nr:MULTISPECIES: hypothetical protein [unclassified Listeria]